LVAVLRLIDFDVVEATRWDVERVVAAINQNPQWREETKRHKRIVLRRLIQYAKYGSCERGAPVPPEVSWIRVSSKKRDRDSRITYEGLLSQRDFEAMVKAADNPRDRAMLYVLYEGALRPGELLNMRVKSVEFKENYCLITVSGKTGLKRIPLILSYKPLLEWIENHPLKTDLDAPLWPSLASNYLGKPLSYRHFRLTIKRLAKKAGLKKEVWPYLFRHSTITRLAKILTEAQLEQFAGWMHGSKMSARYVHFSARDLEDTFLKMHGLKSGEEEPIIPKLEVCPRCKAENPPGRVYCGFCGFVLDRETAIKTEEEERSENDLIIQRLEELAKRLEALEESFHSVFGERAESYHKPCSSSP